MPSDAMISNINLVITGNSQICAHQNQFIVFIILVNVPNVLVNKRVSCKTPMVQPLRTFVSDTKENAFDDEL